MWQEKIKSDSGIWAGVVGYAKERIEQLTHTCTSPQSTELEIRMAQAGIEELRRLQSVPDMLSATSQLMAAKGQRNGY